ncbi:MAG: AraC family transcriptional regulator [Ginsengibacter sp.]
MITTLQIAPSPALAPFVHSYTYREFDTQGIDLVKPWHASHETNIIFFFEDLPSTLTDSSGQILKRGKNCDVMGMATKYNGNMTFNGKYSFMQIIFQPHGFHTIFNISPLAIADKIVWSGDIFNSDLHNLHERLFNAISKDAMASLANEWLLNYLNKQRTVDYKNPITIAANIITKNAGLVSIDSLARFACMSMRNFERIFINETGMSPKQLCCIARFNKALNLKLADLSTKWISVAYEAGYFDQMHLIKDFKRFCGEAPSSLLKHVPLLEENYISRI